MTGNNTMPFFMKQHGIHDVVKLNYYPTGMTGTGILAMWGYALLSDWLKTKVPASIAIGATFIISGALCLSSAVPFGGKLFAFCKSFSPLTWLMKLIVGRPLWNYSRTTKLVVLLG